MSNLGHLLRNIRWMKDLFISGDDDYSPAFRSDEPALLPEATVRERRDDDSATLNELAADMAVVEESNRTSAVRLFVDENVGDNWQILVQSLKGAVRRRCGVRRSKRVWGPIL